MKSFLLVELSVFFSIIEGFQRRNFQGIGCSAWGHFCVRSHFRRSHYFCCQEGGESCKCQLIINMSQKFLDPRGIVRGCQPCQHVPATLPLAVRELGHLPNLAQLLPGDLILISPLAPTILQKQIQKGQKLGGYHEDNARWTHAAVYLGSHSTFARRPSRVCVETQCWIRCRVTWLEPDVIPHWTPIRGGKLLFPRHCNWVQATGLEAS